MAGPYTAMYECALPEERAEFEALKAEEAAAFDGVVSTVPGSQPRSDALKRLADAKRAFATWNLKVAARREKVGEATRADEEKKVDRLLAGFAPSLRPGTRTDERLQPHDLFAAYRKEEPHSTTLTGSFTAARVPQ